MPSRASQQDTSTHPQTLQQFLTAKDLEAILRIDVKTIYAYVQKGLIPYVKIQSNVRFSIREILDWIEKQSYRPHQARNK